MQSLNELLAVGRLREAAELATERLTKNLQDVEALAALARVALANEDDEQAEEWLARADPEGRTPTPDIRLVRATLAMRRQQWQVARALYLPLVRPPKPQVDALYGLAVVMGALEQWTEASALLQEAVRLRPNHPDIRYELGRAFLHLGQPVAAGYHLIRGLRLNPQDERGYLAVAHLTAQRGKRHLARRVLEMGLRRVPGSPMLRDALVELTAAPTSPRFSHEQRRAQAALRARVLDLLNRRRPRDVLVLLSDAYQQGTPPNAELKLLEAETLESQVPPNVAGARRAYEDAIALEPGNWVAYNNLGLLLMRQGSPETLAEGTRRLEQARDCAPGELEPELNLALAYAQAQRYEQSDPSARKTLEELPAQNPPRSQVRKSPGLASSPPAPDEAVPRRRTR